MAVDSAWLYLLALSSVECDTRDTRYYRRVCIIFLDTVPCRDRRSQWGGILSPSRVLLNRNQCVTSRSFRSTVSLAHSGSVSDERFPGLVASVIQNRTLSNRTSPYDRERERRKKDDLATGSRVPSNTRQRRVKIHPARMFNVESTSSQIKIRPRASLVFFSLYN